MLDAATKGKGAYSAAHQVHMKSMVNYIPKNLGYFGIIRGIVLMQALSIQFTFTHLCLKKKCQMLFFNIILISILSNTFKYSFYGLCESHLFVIYFAGDTLTTCSTTLSVVSAILRCRSGIFRDIQ